MAVETPTLSDTFAVPAQGKFYVAGEEVSENVYKRVQELQERLEAGASTRKDEEVERSTSSPNTRLTPDYYADIRAYFRDHYDQAVCELAESRVLLDEIEAVIEDGSPSPFVTIATILAKRKPLRRGAG